MFAGFPQRIFYLVTGTGPPCTTVYLPATPPDFAELANNASFIVSFSRGETGSILNEMKRQGNAAAWFLKNKPPDQSASSGFVVSSTSILKLLISLIRWATPYQVSCTSVLRLVTSVMAGRVKGLWQEAFCLFVSFMWTKLGPQRFRCVLRQLVCFYFILFLNTWQLFTVNNTNVRVLPLWCNRRESGSWRRAHLQRKPRQRGKAEPSRETGVLVKPFPFIPVHPKHQHTLWIQ